MKCRQRSLRLRVFLFFQFLLFLQTFQVVSAFALTVNSLGDYDNIAVLEVAGDYAAIDEYGNLNASARQDVSREFFRQHGDYFDFLVTFTNFDYLMPAPGVKAFLLPAKNDVEGIGVDLYDATNLFSADGAFLDRLEGLIEMGPLRSHELVPSDPDFEKTLQTLTHEMVHRWAAYLSYEQEGELRDDLLGPGQSHWSFLLDSAGSTLYGNHWRDNGDGTFTSVDPPAALEGSYLGRMLSPLELYLMGLKDSSGVPPLTLIDSPGIDPARMPEVGVTIPGVARSITIDQIRFAMGERYPVARQDKEFRMAFLLLVEPGTWSPDDPQSMKQLQLLGNLQREWEERFPALTHGSAVISAGLEELLPAEENPRLTQPDGLANSAPNIDAAVNWLISKQNPDGSWQDQPGTIQRDTATSVAALKPFINAASDVSRGLNWLGSVSPESFDSLARKALAGSSIDPAKLVSTQNNDGGWGSTGGYRSNPYDTALVLAALAHDESTNNPAIDAAVNYLFNTQQYDGGWSSGVGESQVLPTAYAITALNAYRENWPAMVVPMIEDGTAWLIGQQNSDGGFGNDSSTTYATAAVISAIKPAATSPAVVDAAVTYLLNSQGSTGSWRGSVFQTAMAINALYAGQVAVDLAVTAEDISFSPPEINSYPQSVDVSVYIRNTGSTVASATKTALYDGPPETGLLLAVKTVDIPANDSLGVVFNTTINDPFDHEFHVVIDPDNQLAEASEWNNSTFGTVEVNVPPPQVSFRDSSVVMVEENAPVTVTIDLTYAWDQDISVDYVLNNKTTALAGSDYTLTEGTIVFRPGETSKNFTITLFDDELAESAETITVDLANPSAGSVGIGQYVLTIQDDDSPPAVSILLPSAGASADSAPILSYILSYSVTHGDVVVTINGAPVVTKSGEILNFPHDGSYTIKVEVTDAYGRTGSDEVIYTLDTSGPVIDLVSPVAGTILDSAPLLYYELNEGDVTAISVDGVETANRSGDVLDELSDGSHLLQIDAVDDLGNASTITRAFTIDQDGSTTPEEGLPDLLESVEIDAADRGWHMDAKVDSHGNYYIVAKPMGGYFANLNKYAPDGNLLWTRELRLEPSFSYSYPDYGGALAVDDCGNVYVAGLYEASGYLSISNFFVARFDSDGNELWHDTFGAYYSDNFIHSIYLDAHGRFYITGREGSYGLLRVYDANGVVVRSINYDVKLEYPGEIAGDEQGNIYVVYGPDDTLRKYSSDGSLLWQKQYPEGIANIAFSQSGEMFFAGRVVRQVDPVNGAVIWESEPIGLSTNYNNGDMWIGFDGKGGVLIAAMTAIGLDGHQILDASDPFIAKYDYAGRKVWVKQLDGPVEGAYLAGAFDAYGRLNMVRKRQDDSGTTRQYVFYRDKFGFSAVKNDPGVARSFYFQSASGCTSGIYSPMVATTLAATPDGCSSFDEVILSGRKKAATTDMLVAYADNGGYAEETDVELSGNNNLSIFSSDPNGTGSVSLLEVDPQTGAGLRVLSSFSFPLTTNRTTYVTDLTSLTGTVAMGNTFGIMLSVSTTDKSNNSITWGSQLNCPADGRQQVNVYERPFDGSAPVSAISDPADGTTHNPGYLLVKGSADDGDGSGLKSVEVSVDNGQTWQPAADTSVNGSWATWAFPWVGPLTGDHILRSRATDKSGNVEAPGSGISLTILDPRPELTVNPVISPINKLSQLITGRATPGSIITVDLSQTTALITPVAQYADGAWEFTVTNLIPNTENLIIVQATNSDGVSQETVSIRVDTVLPLKVNYQSPVHTDSQGISGYAEVGANLNIEVNPPAAKMPVEVLANGIWTTTVPLIEGENVVVVEATDQAGNSASETFTIRYDAMTVELSRASIYRDESTSVELRINNLIGNERVLIGQFFDVNNSGVIDPADPVVRQFYVRDESYSGDYNVPSDESYGVEGIRTTLNYHFINDILHAPGRHLFRVTSELSEQEVFLDVLPSGYQQSISGYVLDELGGVVSGAVIRLLDKWGRPAGYTFSDDKGAYSLSIEASGEYQLIPAAFGFVHDKGSGDLTRVEPAESVYQDIRMISAENLASGIVHDGSDNLPDILLRFESGDYVGFARSDLSGAFAIHLPEGDYDVFVDSFISSTTQRVYSYLPDTPVFNLAVSNSTAGNDIELQGYVDSCQMKVYDEFGTGMSGIPLKNSIGDGTSAVVFSTSNETGLYSVASNFMDISLNDRLAQSIGYVGTSVTYPSNNCSLKSGDVTVYPIDAWVAGTVRDDLGQPVKGVPVRLSGSATGAVVGDITIDDGTYRLGSVSGPADIEISPEILGYHVTLPQAVDLLPGQTKVQDFVISRPAAEPDLAVTSFTSTLVFDDTRIEMPVTIANLGETNVVAGVGLDFYLSQDAILATDSDTLICNTTLPGLAAGQTYSTTQTCNFPSSIPGTTYAVFAVVDGTDILSESNEGNNLGQANATTAPLLENTILISKASYAIRRDVLDVDASSEHPDAGLKIEYGSEIIPMVFTRLSKGKYLWSYTGPALGQYTGVKVFGPEGDKTVTVTLK